MATVFSGVCFFNRASPFFEMSIRTPPVIPARSVNDELPSASFFFLLAASPVVSTFLDVRSVSLPVQEPGPPARGPTVLAGQRTLIVT